MYRSAYLLVFAAPVFSVTFTSAAEPSVRATAAKADTQIKVTAPVDAKTGATVLDITCAAGIDRATIERTGEKWPQQVVVRLNLKGLESFAATSGADTFTAAVSSSPGNLTRLALRSADGSEKPIDKTSPWWSDVRIVGGNGIVPLKGGHFEVPLPAKLFEANPKSITLRWIDFYR